VCFVYSFVFLYYCFCFCFCFIFNYLYLLSLYVVHIYIFFGIVFALFLVHLLPFLLLLLLCVCAFPTCGLALCFVLVQNDHNFGGQRFIFHQRTISTTFCHQSYFQLSLTIVSKFPNCSKNKKPHFLPI
jgi:hypothetical protein